MQRRPHFAKIRNAQAGFSLIELSIAVLIALFLLGGLVTLVMGTRRTSSTQTAQSQLQDNQRIAMTVIGNVVQKAGYFPDPVNQQLSSFARETFASVTMPSSQVLGGTFNAAAPGDTLMVRFFAPASDPNTSIIDCAGQSNPAPSSAPNSIWYTNMFQVGRSSAPHRGCSACLAARRRGHGADRQPDPERQEDGRCCTEVSGIGATADDYSVVQYLNCQPGDRRRGPVWPNVTAVKVTLTFLVPAYGTTGGQMSTQTTDFTRVIPIMSRAGVDT